VSAQQNTVAAIAGHTQVAIWPETPPDAQPVPGPETVGTDSDFLVLAGRS